MNIALQKSLGLLLLILIGFALQKKIGSNDNIKGIKELILSIALPATIFVALLKIDLEFELLLLPILALGLNFSLLILFHYFLPLLGLPIGHSKHHTALMLLPSLAPGLSCFPFLAEYLGEASLAKAALADIGNKFFVLIFLYALALHWHNQKHLNQQQIGKRRKFKQLLQTLVNEPINLVMVLAFVLLGFGITLNTFPYFLETTILRLSTLMMPLILIFIGLAVKIKWRELPLMLSILGWRSGLAFCISAILLFFLPNLTSPMILLLVVFPQSSCSFWPFAHMSAMDSVEKSNNIQNPTFDSNFALSILACSLPFSTFISLGVFSFSSLFMNPIHLFGIGVFILGISSIPQLIRIVNKTRLGLA
jgi:malate permease and related proteins